MHWTLPAGGLHIGLEVTVGHNGPYLPHSAASRLLIGGVPFVGMTDGAQRGVGAPILSAAASAPVCAARYAPSTADLAVDVGMPDLSQYAPDGSSVLLVARVFRLGGVDTYTLSVTVDRDAPSGFVYALVTRTGTFLRLEGMTGEPVALRVTCEDGSAYDVPVTSDFLVADGQLQRPMSVRAVDANGNVSFDLLVDVEVESGATDGEQTTLSPWILPPYLDPARPNLAAFLAAFADSLDVRPDEAGLYLNLWQSGGVPLDTLAAHFTAARADDESDIQLARRAAAALQPAKSSLAGLGAMLRANGIYGAEVHDLYSLSGSQPTVFDGSWCFDGSKHFDGGVAAYDVSVGQVIAIFDRDPLTGWDAPLQVLQRYKAAGVAARVLRRAVRTTVPAPVAYRRVVRWPVQAAQVRVKWTASNLVFDGTWNFDGTETFDGYSENHPTVRQTMTV